VARNIKDRIFMGFSWELCCQQDWDRVLKQWWKQKDKGVHNSSYQGEFLCIWVSAWWR